MLMISVIDWSNVQKIIKKINIGLSEVSSQTVFKTGCVHVYAEWRLQQARVSTQNQTSCLPGLTHSCTVGMKAGNCICHTSFLKLSVTFQFLLQIRSTRKRFRMQKKKKSHYWWVAAMERLTRSVERGVCRFRIIHEDHPLCCYRRLR